MHIIIFFLVTNLLCDNLFIVYMLALKACGLMSFNILILIEAARIANGRVLVHCQAGVSRSPTIVMAYIMARFEKSLQETFTFMHNRRSIISPNLNFMGQLLEFGQRIDLSSLFDTAMSCKYPQITSNWNSVSCN